MRIDFHKWQDFRDCPKKFFLEHIQRAPYTVEIDDYSSLYGRTVEKFFELFCNIWRFKTPYIFPDVIRERLKPIYETEIRNSTINWSSPKIAKSKDELFEQICADVCAIMESHNQNYFLNTRSEISIDMTLKSGHIINGRIDFLHGIPLSKEYVIIDGKGSTKIGKNVSNDQLYLYAFLYFFLYKKLPVEMGFFYYRFNTFVPVPINIDILNEFRARLSIDIKKMTEDSDFNPTPSAQACKYCHYLATCLDGRRAKAQRARESTIELEGEGVIEFGL